jgi:spermidine/putrescine transport system substrate-binding protein
MMKKLLILTTLALLGLATTVQAAGTLRLLTWKGYAPQPLVDKFEKQTGIKV